MIELKASAHAKLNLTLDVVGTRPDGYHDLRMVMQEIDLGDDITVLLKTGKPWSVETDSGEIPCDENNLAVKAALLFAEESGIDFGGLKVVIRKQTPVCAGMGGGSADAAAVLRLLYDHYRKPFPEKTLYHLAELAGSDVPFALFGGTALAEEKGQVLKRLPSMPRCSIVLCKPDFPISTPELFRAIDREPIALRPNTEKMIQALEKSDLKGIAEELCNVFYPVVNRDHPEVQTIRLTMMEAGALNACMTGSGPTVFGLFEQLQEAETCRDILLRQYRNTFLTFPIE